MQKPVIRTVTEQDLDRCYEIECAAYSGDEAATREKIQRRIERYPEGFILLEVGGCIAGFINSGAANHVQLSDEDFKDLAGHQREGENMVILSVAVHPDYQRRGLASQLMDYFIAMARRWGKRNLYLISQRSLVPMYASFGFVDLGPSDSSHGGLSWHEMSMSLADC